MLKAYASGGKGKSTTITNKKAQNLGKRSISRGSNAISATSPRGRTALYERIVRAITGALQ